MSSAKTAAVPDRIVARVAGAAVLVSLFAFLYYLQRRDVLLYGDAVAHINIARRVFDSQTPGLLQLGTVWLPLPHLLMIPFIFSDAMWQSGAGGSIPSMIAYVLGVVGIFRLVRGMLETNSRTKPAAVMSACAAAFAYGANPNLIYMQATAMTESIYLTLFVWAVVYFAEFIRALNANPVGANQLSPALQRGVRREDPSKSRRDDPVPTHILMRCACCLAGAELTRYDGWFLAFVMGAAVVVIVLRQWQNRALRRAGAKFLLGIAVAPLLWLAYNRVVYGNALEFANGPYSAKAIEQRVGAPNPALHNARVAAIYYLKSGQLNMAEGNWGRFWVAAAVVALAVGLRKLRAQSAPMLLLWVPLGFYALSIAYGSVPIHVHTWWPFATFNQRYGLQLLPMFAVSIGLLTGLICLVRASGRHGGKLAPVTFAFVVLSYASVWKVEPQCLKEARRNWEIRNTLNSAVEQVIGRLPRNSRFLMELGEHVGVMQQAAIPLRQVVNNENHRPWKRPSDPEGLWERALADPPRYADFVIAFDGDAVDQRANKINLTELTEIHATGQPRARIYAAHSAPNQLH
ncbi:MAG TPA: hypothetical protein VKD23_12125 [Terriglobales bacterium]|nr:hypothetical protein [Terriglobales bacterium]